MRKWLLAMAMAMSGAAVAAPMTLQDYMALSGPPPDATLTYGAAASQYVALYRPAGDGPFPVVILVHGGCWHKEFGGMAQMADMAGALRAQGIAVWVVEYRRVDEEGGGFPGTYFDIADALDLLAARAGAERLDLGRLVAVGHSAGGHLVQWIGARGRIAPTSPLYRPHFPPVRQIIALGSIGDLRGDRDLISGRCDTDPFSLTGGPGPGRPDVYADTSPADMLPNGSVTLLVNGVHDNLATPAHAAAYAERARRAGDAVDLLVLPSASHFDEVAASSPAWRLLLPAIRRALGLP